MSVDDAFGFRQTRGGRSVGQAIVDHELKQVLILEDDFVVLGIDRHGAISRIGIANDSYGWPVQGGGTAPIRNGSGWRLGGEPLLPQGGGQTNRTGRGSTQLTSHRHFR